jgi:hypothetical protein
MGGLTLRFRASHIAIVAIAVALGVVAWIGAPRPAEAFVIGFGFPYPGFYAAPWPYYPAPLYYPYYPPPAYYPAPAPGYYPPPATAPTTQAAPPSASAPAITYTAQPAFTNAAGQTCREFRAASGALGTACRDASGQWRVAD